MRDCKEEELLEWRSLLYYIIREMRKDGKDSLGRWKNLCGVTKKQGHMAL